MSATPLLVLSCSAHTTPRVRNAFAPDPQVDCDSDRYRTMGFYDAGAIALIGLGVPLFYLCLLHWNRVDLDRLRRFQIEAEDMQEESKARKMTLSELTIDEFERAELMRLLEEAEVERIEKKRFHLFRTLPASLKKLTNGYTSKCFWFEIFECFRKLLIIGIPALPIFPPGGVAQRAAGMVICFMSFGVIFGFKPYDEDQDNSLALLCQFEIFILMVASMVADVSNDTALVDACLTFMLCVIVFFALATEGELLEGWGDYFGLTNEEPQARPNREYVKPIIRKVILGVSHASKIMLEFLDKIGGVADQEQLREEVRRKRAEKHPELGRRHRISSWKASATFEESNFAGVQAEVAEEGGSHHDLVNRLTRRGGDDAADYDDDDDDDDSAMGSRSGTKSGIKSSRRLLNVDIHTFLHPESAGIKLTLGELKQSANAASCKTAKSVAALVRAIKLCMEASLSSSSANWPSLTPRGQHMTQPYRAAVSQVSAIAQLNESASEIFEAHHELRGIGFLAGSGAPDRSINVRSQGSPDDAFEWKQLVSKCVQETMSTAKTLRVLKQILVNLPKGQDADISGMRAAQLSGDFGGLLGELGNAATATAATLRGLLTSAVDAGADPKYAPWRLPPEDSPEKNKKVIHSPSVEPDSARSLLDGASTPGSGGPPYRLSIDERLVAARRRSTERALAKPGVSFPEMLPKPSILPVPLGGSPAFHEQMSTPNKLGNIKDREEDVDDPDEVPRELSKGSPESSRLMRRAQLQQIRRMSFLTASETAQEEEVGVDDGGQPNWQPEVHQPGSSSSSSTKQTDVSNPSPSFARPLAPSFAKMMRGVADVFAGAESPAPTLATDSPPAPLRSDDKGKDKRARSRVNIRV
jgi:hypothetical protein